MTGWGLTRHRPWPLTLRDCVKRLRRERELQIFRREPPQYSHGIASDHGEG